MKYKIIETKSKVYPYEVIIIGDDAMIGRTFKTECEAYAWIVKKLEVVI
jgi:hypothetical protein